jgi:hypothetical protein
LTAQKFQRYLAMLLDRARRGQAGRSRQTLRAEAGAQALSGQPPPRPPPDQEHPWLTPSPTAP